MLKLYFLLVISLSFVLLSGCQSLPPGEPPEGPIITIQDNSDVILDENAAIEKMTTALASSEPLITSATQLNVILAKTNVQSEYSNNATAISARVLGELINTGIIDCDTGKKPDFILTSTLVKLQTMQSGDVIFKWIMGLTNEGSLAPVFSYSLKVKITPNAPSVHLIEATEIVPTYK